MNPPLARIPGLQRLVGYAGAPLGRLRSHRQLLVVWPERIVLAPRIALYCHYDPGGAVRPDVLRQLRDLGEAGFSIVLISNSGTLQPDAFAALQTLCAAVLVRRNVGRDFCAWRDAMERLGLPQAHTEQLLLANDSVYGPVHGLPPLLARMQGGGLWGMTDSTQRGYHVQSYFLLAGRDVLHSAAWRAFWRGVRPLPSKWLMVGRYEVGLTRRLSRAGFACRALFPCPGSAGRRGVNPMLQHWRALLLAGLPYLKRELLHDNPTGVSDIAEWPEQVTRIAGEALAAEIGAHLKQLQNRPATPAFRGGRRPQPR